MTTDPRPSRDVSETVDLRLAALSEKPGALLPIFRVVDSIAVQCTAPCLRAQPAAVRLPGPECSLVAENCLVSPEFVQNRALCTIGSS
jgi:hypothetical protein